MSYDLWLEAWVMMLGEEDLEVSNFSVSWIPQGCWWIDKTGRLAGMVLLPLKYFNPGAVVG